MPTVPEFVVDIQFLKDALSRALQGGLRPRISILDASIASNSNAYLRWRIDERFWFAVCKYYNLEGESHDRNSALIILNSISNSKAKSAHNPAVVLNNLSYRYFATLIVYLHRIEGSLLISNYDNQRAEILLLAGASRTYNRIPTYASSIGVLTQEIADLFEYKQRIFTIKKDCKVASGLQDTGWVSFEIKIPTSNMQVSRRYNVNSAVFLNSTSCLWLSRDVYNTNATAIFNDDNYHIVPLIEHMFNRHVFIEVDDTVVKLRSFFDNYRSLVNCIDDIRARITNGSATCQDISFILAYLSARLGHPEAVKVVLQFCIIKSVAIIDPPGSTTDNFEELVKFYKSLCSSVQHFKSNNSAERDYADSYNVAREYESISRPAPSVLNKNKYDYSGFSQVQPKADFVTRADYATCKVAAIRYLWNSASQGYQPAIDRLNLHYSVEYQKLQADAQSLSASKLL